MDEREKRFVYTDEDMEGVKLIPGDGNIDDALALLDDDDDED